MSAAMLGALVVGAWLGVAAVLGAALLIASARGDDEGWGAHCADALHVGNDEPIPYLSTDADFDLWDAQLTGRA